MQATDMVNIIGAALLLAVFAWSLSQVVERTPPMPMPPAIEVRIVPHSATGETP